MEEDMASVAKELLGVAKPRREGELQDLLARVEAASGADRALDAQIYVALHPDEPGMVHPGSPDGLRGSSHAPLREMDWPAWERVAAARGSDLGMVANHHLWPAYTASLDATLVLVERVLPGWWWAVGHYGPHGLSTATVSRDGQRANDSEATTPALALIAALLKAVSASTASPAAGNDRAREANNPPPTDPTHD